jgi:hypothetical protein
MKERPGVGMQMDCDPKKNGWRLLSSGRMNPLPSFWYKRRIFQTKKLSHIYKATCRYIKDRQQEKEE